MLEDNRDEDDQDHYDGLDGQLDEISDELINRGVKDWQARSGFPSPGRAACSS